MRRHGNLENLENFLTKLRYADERRRPVNIQRLSKPMFSASCRNYSATRESEHLEDFAGLELQQRMYTIFTLSTTTMYKHCISQKVWWIRKGIKSAEEDLSEQFHVSYACLTIIIIKPKLQLKKIYISRGKIERLNRKISRQRLQKIQNFNQGTKDIFN